MQIQKESNISKENYLEYYDMHGLSSQNLAMVEDIHGKLFIVCCIHFAHGPTGPKSTLIQY